MTLVGYDWFCLVTFGSRLARFDKLWSYVAYVLAKTCLVFLGLVLLGAEHKVKGRMREETTCMHVLCANTNRFSSAVSSQCPDVEL